MSYTTKILEKCKVVANDSEFVEVFEAKREKMDELRSALRDRLLNGDETSVRYKTLESKWKKKFEELYKIKLTDDQVKRYMEVLKDKEDAVAE